MRIPPTPTLVSLAFAGALLLGCADDGPIRHDPANADTPRSEYNRASQHYQDEFNDNQVTPYSKDMLYRAR